MPDPAVTPQDLTGPARWPPVHTIGPAQPLRWLALGWRDVRRCGIVSVLHGVVLALVGALILRLAYQQFWLLAGAVSGFLVVAPVLATSLYALSRALERGEQANLGVVLRTWLNWQDKHFNKWGHDYWCLVQFGLLLALAGTGWVLTSAALITLLTPVPIKGPVDFVLYVLLAPQGHLFEIWLLLGGVLAAPMFASSVITIPLLLDRRVPLRQAVLISWLAVLRNPVPMGVWAALILSLTLLGMASAFLGLVLAIPVLGHASWYAYRDVVDASQLPAREAC